MPSRSDHYAMQVAAEVRRGNVKDPSRVDLKHLRLAFTETKKKVASPVFKMTKELASSLGQAKWVGGMTMAVRRRTRLPDGTFRWEEEEGAK